MLVPVPASITQHIAESASRESKSFATSRGWSGAQAISPIWGQGVAGVQVQQTYLMYQERGTRPRIMRELEGKTIPIKGRFVRAKGVGQPGWVTLPGGVKKWRDQKWRNPGIKPTNFMRNSLEVSVKASRSEIMDLMKGLLGAPR